MNWISIKKYRCPEDACSSSKMRLVYNNKSRLRDELRQLPNEILLCPICNKLYRWWQLREMDICIPVQNYGRWQKWHMFIKMNIGALRTALKHYVCG